MGADELRPTRRGLPEFDHGASRESAGLGRQEAGGLPRTTAERDGSSHAVSRREQQVPNLCSPLSSTLYVIKMLALNDIVREAWSTGENNPRTPRAKEQSLPSRRDRRLCVPLESPVSAALAFDQEMEETSQQSQLLPLPTPTCPSASPSEHPTRSRMIQEVTCQG
ncbi:unnamed protein product [Lampetra planeri]